MENVKVGDHVIPLYTAGEFTRLVWGLYAVWELENEERRSR